MKSSWQRCIQKVSVNLPAKDSSCKKNIYIYICIYRHRCPLPVRELLTQLASSTISGESPLILKRRGVFTAVHQDLVQSRRNEGEVGEPVRERGTRKAVALFNEQLCGGGPSSPPEIMVQNANASEASSPARETSKDIWIIISQIRIFFFLPPLAREEDHMTVRRGCWQPASLRRR